MSATVSSRPLGDSRRHRHRSDTLRRTTWWAIALGTGLALLAVTVPALDAGGAIHTLQRGVARLEQATAALGNPLDASSGDRLDAAAAMQREAASDIEDAAARLRANPGLQAAALVPAAAAQRVAALGLAESAGSAASAVQDLIQVALQARRLHAGGAPPGLQVVQLMAAAAPGLGDASRHLDAALARLRRDAGAGLVAPLGREVAAATNRLASARRAGATASAVADLLPGLLGAQGSRTYLLLFPNPYELRPAGGLFGALGSVTVDRGSPGAIFVAGYETINAVQPARYPVPAPLARRMSFAGDSLDIGDAGWDPDFPSSAALAERMYRSATGRQVDGTIAIDPYAISALLGVTGPIDVTPYGEFTGDDFFPKLNAIVNVERGPGSGKQALVPISAALVGRVLAAPPSLWLRMLAALLPEAGGGHVLLSLHDARAATAASDAHIDGALVQPPPGEDYVMVVDANVGGTKGDAIVRKSAREKVEVGLDGLARHELTVRYEYPAGQADPSVPAGADPAYRDYLRVYLPQTTTLTGLVEGDVEDLTVEHGKRVLGTFFRTAPGQSTELTLRYETPLAPGQTYRLYVQKQAGIAERPLDLAVSVPGSIRHRLLTGDRDAEVTVAW